MNQSDSETKKQKILAEINELRSEVGDNKKIWLRAQEDIFDVLDNATKELYEDSSELSLYQVGSKISMARKRYFQAGNQKLWLPLFIGIWTLAFFAVAAWIISEGEFWPKAIAAEAWQILFGAVLWGLIGATTDAFRELHTRVARQELDPNRLAWYLAHPLIGAGLGGILFLLVSAGLLVTGQEVGEFNPSLPLILGALAGFEQRNIIRYLRDTIKKILGITDEKVVDEGG